MSTARAIRTITVEVVTNTPLFGAYFSLAVLSAPSLRNWEQNALGQSLPAGKGLTGRIKLEGYEIAMNHVLLSQSGLPRLFWRGSRSPEPLDLERDVINGVVYFRPGPNDPGPGFAVEPGVYFSATPEFARHYGTPVAYHLRVNRILRHEGPLTSWPLGYDAIYRTRGKGSSIHDATEVAVRDPRQAIPFNRNPYVELGEVYEDEPGRREWLWDHVDRDNWEKAAFNEVVLDPAEVVQWLTPRRDMTIIEAWEHHATPDQQQIVDWYRGHGLGDAREGHLIVDLNAKQLIDGWHRAVALAYEGVGHVKALDVGNEKMPNRNPPPHQATLELLRRRVKDSTPLRKAFLCWLHDLIEDPEEVADALKDPELLNEYFEDYLGEELNLSIRPDGLLEVDWFLHEVPTDLIRGLQIAVFHGTSTALLPAIRAHGLQAATAKEARTWNASTGAGVYVSTRRGLGMYAGVAARRHGGEPVILTLRVLPSDLRPDPDDADLQAQTALTQFVVDFVPASDVVEWR